VAATYLELKLTLWMLQGIAAVIVLIMVVVYQTEIRRFLERFPGRFLRKGRRSEESHSGVADLLAETAIQLSAERRGALIILPGRDPLEGVITEGTMLDGHLSKNLLLSIFDPNSPGHDGALIVREGRVERFGSRLPLSEQEEQLRDRGTRHAAALGLSEKADALVLIVSEETGRVALARDRRLRTVSDLGKLGGIIDEFLLAHAGPLQKVGRFEGFSWWVGIEGISSLVMAAALWLVLVPGAVIERVTYEVPIEVRNIPEGFVLTGVKPPKVAVTLSAERRKLFQVDPRELEIRLDGTLTRFGRQTYPITKAHLLLPPAVEIADLAPEEVQVTVRKTN